MASNTPPPRPLATSGSARFTPATKVKPATNSLGILPFTRRNYTLLIIGVAIIVFGYYLMSVDPFIDATKFSISLYIAPWVIVIGYIEIIFAILAAGFNKADSHSTNPGVK